jgi:serine/threonine protein phosphatase 1
MFPQFVCDERRRKKRSWVQSISPSEKPKIAGRPASIAQGTRIYAIGDIHGRLDLLDKILSVCAADTATRPVERPIYVFLGDYIDRGNWSRETIDRLIEHGAAFESIFLKGNHELIAINCLRDPTLIDQWFRLGGRETLASYGVASDIFSDRKKTVETQLAFHNALPQSHIRFFRELKKSFTCGDFFFVHAGVRPDIELTKQTEKDLLWIRAEFLNSSQDFGKIIVHGHTPIKNIDVRSNRINIDTGAFATGVLTCLVIEGDRLSVLSASA